MPHHSKMMSELRTLTITENGGDRGGVCSLARSHLFLIENYIVGSCVISGAFRFVNERGRIEQRLPDNVTLLGSESDQKCLDDREFRYPKIFQ